MNPYEAKQEARRERLERRAERLRAEGRSLYDRAHKMAEAIPFGQPILVGHHSEGRDRRYRARFCNMFDRSFAATKAAGELEARAASVGTGGISSDDPDAVTKLEEELAEHKAKQARMKKINAAHAKFKRNPASVDTAADLSEADKKLVREYVPAYSWEPHPFAPYQLSNLGANIRRIEQRIEHLKRNATRERKEYEINGVKIVENVEENRVQIFFPGKPAADVRTQLKSSGWRWSPMAGAWQRHLSTNAIWGAEHIAKSLAPKEEPHESSTASGANPAS